MLKQPIKRIFLCMALAAPAFSGLALAADSGFQLGLDAGKAEARKYCDNVTNCDSADTMVRANAGYKFTPFVSAELGYTSFGTLFDANENNAAVQQEANAWTVSVLGTWPINEKFDLFGRIGAARYDLDNVGTTIQNLPVNDENNSTKPYYGAGAKFNLTDNFALRAEYQIYSDISGVNGRKDDIDSWSGGVVFAF